VIRSSPGSSSSFKSKRDSKSSLPEVNTTCAPGDAEPVTVRLPASESTVS
jgi:hypothetical protein